MADKENKFQKKILNKNLTVYSQLAFCCFVFSITFLLPRTVLSFLFLFFSFLFLFLFLSLKIKENEGFQESKDLSHENEVEVKSSL